MNKNYFKSFFSLLLITILVGCSQETGPSMTDPFIGGTTGLTMDFIDGAPPAEVYDGGAFPFTAVVKLENVGETDVALGTATIKISGIDPTDFGTTGTSLSKATSENLLGSKKGAEGNIIEGGILHLTFPSTGDFNYGSQLSGNIQFPFLANLCYKYATTSNTMLCIRENPLGTTESICNVNEAKQTFNSGAPIQVANFKETPRGNDKIAFTFDIIHRGTGKTFGQNTECDNTITNRDKVFVTVNTGIDGLDCTGLTEGTSSSGYIILYEGKRSVTCTQNIAGTSGDFEKVTEIIIDYDYEQEKLTHVLVKHAEG
ncbi:hypothetical protein KY313_00435 [Candidatus Woesearchaeota archaeon]|nr:hypothetical protein [Candidatus Woesearchaeota archaeon]